MVPVIWGGALGVRAGRPHAPPRRQHQRSKDQRGGAPTPLSAQAGQDRAGPSLFIQDNCRVTPPPSPAPHRFPIFRRKPLFRGDLDRAAVRKNVIRQGLWVNISIQRGYGHNFASFPVHLCPTVHNSLIFNDLRLKMSRQRTYGVRMPRRGMSGNAVSTYRPIQGYQFGWIEVAGICN